MECKRSGVVKRNPPKTPRIFEKVPAKGVAGGKTEMGNFSKRKKKS